MEGGEEKVVVVVVFAVFLWQPCPANGENSWLMSFVAVELFDFRGEKTGTRSTRGLS